MAPDVRQIAKSMAGRLPSWLQWELMGLTGLNVPAAEDPGQQADGTDEVDDILTCITTHHPEFEIEDATVLEVGCGHGRLLLPMADRAKEAFGTDISRASLRKTRQLAESEGHAVKLARAEESIPFDVDFDLVYSVATFMHLPRRQMIRYLDTIHGALSSDGILYFQVPGLEAGPGESSGAERLVAEDLDAEYDYRMRYYTKDELHAYLDALGYSSVHVDPYWAVTAKP